jgi:chloramphenicol-sensitive protein RarD
MTHPAPAPVAARGAVIAGVVCYTLWGLLPIYLLAVGHTGASASEIIAHRALWSVPWAGLLVVLAGQGRQVVAVLKNPRTLSLLAASALLIAGNWLLFVWAVGQGRTIEASLGYYINPLMNMAAGAILFRERMDLTGKIAIGLAAIGVAVQTLALGHLPFIALGLALTFTGYGLIRKQVAADAQTGLLVECLVLAAPAIAYIVWLQHSGAGHFTARPATTVLLLLAGPVTVAPLALFSWAARRLPLSTVGFLQFIGPTLQFFVGVESGERLNAMRIASFGFIWIGVVVFAYGAWRGARTHKPVVA